jgi:hypothetical protein
MHDTDRYQQAKARVAELRSFSTHAAAYVLVNLLLLALNLLTTPTGLWFYWPLLGWGIGLGAHALTVYVAGGHWGTEWEARKVRELMAEDEQAIGRAHEG